MASLADLIREKYAASRRQGMQHQQSYSQTDPGMERYLAGKESASRGVPLEAPMLSPDDLIGSGLLKGLLGGAALMGGIKSVGRAAPQAEALRLAQLRAALPVEQNGLGLPANNTAQMRADTMGFDTPMYHSTPYNPEILLPRPPMSSRRGTDFGVHVGDSQAANGAIVAPWHEKELLRQANDPSYSQSLRDGAREDLERRYENQSVIPLLVNPGRTLDVPDFGRWNYPNNMTSNVVKETWSPPHNQIKDNIHTNDRATLQELVDKAIDASKSGGEEKWTRGIEETMKDRGYESLAYHNMIEGDGGKSMMFVDPDRIRSRFAAFDPWRRNAAIASAMGTLAPDLLAQEREDIPRRPMSDLMNVRTD